MNEDSHHNDFFDRGRLISSWLVTKYEGMKPKISAAAWYVIIILVGLFILSFILELIGIATERNEFIALGRIAKAFFSLIIMAMAAIVAIVLKSITRGEISVAWYLRFMVHCFLYQLIIAFGIHISAMPVTFAGLTTLTFATCIFALTLSLDSMGLKFAGTAILIFGIAGIYYPRGTVSIGKGCKQANEPALVRINHGDVANGKVRFFLKGEPAIWYFITPDNKYELFDSSGKHDIYQGKLVPITPTVVLSIMKDEKLVSPRNFGAGYIQNKPPEQSPASPAALAPPEAEQPAAPAPEPYSPPSHQSSAYQSSPAPSSHTDERTEYAVVVIDEKAQQDWSMAENVRSWLGNSRAVRGLDYVTNLSAQSGNLSYETRTQLSKVAQKIILIVYKTRFDRSEGPVRCWSSSYVAKVIDADSGATIRIIKPDKPFMGRSDTDQDASQIAFGFTQKSIENQCRKYL